MTGTSERFMAAAIKEAGKAKALGEIPVGAVIVRDGKIIARGYNIREKSQHATDHAEMIAINKANKRETTITTKVRFVTVLRVGQLTFMSSVLASCRNLIIVFII